MNHKKNPSISSPPNNGLSSLPHGNMLRIISNPKVSPSKHKPTKSFSSSIHSDLRSFLTNTSSHALENSKMHDVLKPYLAKTATGYKPLPANKTQNAIQPKCQNPKDKTSLLEKRKDLRSTYHTFFSTGFSLFNNKSVTKPLDPKEKVIDTTERPSTTRRLSTSADSPNIFQQKLTDRIPSAPFSTDRPLTSAKRETSKTPVQSHRSIVEKKRSNSNPMNKAKYVFSYEKFHTEEAQKEEAKRPLKALLLQTIKTSKQPHPTPTSSQAPKKEVISSKLSSHNRTISYTVTRAAFHNKKLSPDRSSKKHKEPNIESSPRNIKHLVSCFQDFLNKYKESKQ